MKPTLLVLAAGMGSRYGSLKQMDGIGPNNEAIIDYSIYDAIRAGFGKVVFVIRHSFEKEFKEVFNNERFGGKIEVEFVFQELDKLPEGYSVPEGREKPWGTNHALLMGADAVKEPFAVINADDFYGAEAYKTISDYLVSLKDSSNKYCMVGYMLENTLSEHGSVSRGICETDANGNLTNVVERTYIIKEGDKVLYRDENEEMKEIDPKSKVSMNMFGFTPDYFNYSQEYFPKFLSENKENLKAEFFIPLMVNELISTDKAEMKVLSSEAKWFGVTYKEDKPAVIEKLNGLIAAGVYPQKLWE
ncbi:MAG: nucleotidyltransferase [Rikenellaceae bacterium]|nr:nucleotidyltransferase [Rikenellaceae bacterium]